MDKYIVYKHTSPSGKVYIGITKQNPNRRWKSGHGYKQNKYFYNAILKYGWKNIKHEILYSNLTLEEACIKEKELISFYSKSNICYNIAEGGTNGNTRSRTEKEKDHLRKVIKEYYKTHTSPCKGRHPSKETIALLKEKNKKRWIIDYDKMYSTVITKIKVGVYNIITQEYREFNTEKGAAQKYGIKETTFRRHIDNGSVFRNYIFIPLDTLSLEDALLKAYNREKMNIHCGGQEIKVVQLTLRGEYLTTYLSAKHAELATGIKANGIGKACRGESRCSCGYFWMFESIYSKYEKEGILTSVLNNMIANLYKPRELCVIPIMQTTLDGLPVCVYKGGQDIHRKTGFDGSVISKCCRGKLPKAYGYKWKHITKDEYNQYKKQLIV